jgi:hypothetical protein
MSNSRERGHGGAEQQQHRDRDRAHPHRNADGFASASQLQDENAPEQHELAPPERDPEQGLRISGGEIRDDADCDGQRHEHGHADHVSGHVSESAAAVCLEAAGARHGSRELRDALREAEIEKAGA